MAESLTRPPRRITNMIMKELRLIIKDKAALFLIFLLPVALMGMLWWVIEQSDMGNIQMRSGSNSENGGSDISVPNDSDGDIGGGLRLGLIDLDTTRVYEGVDLSENFTAYLRAMVEELVYYNNTRDAFNDLYAEKIKGYVVIPDGFELNLTLNIPTYIDVHVDATKTLDQSSVITTVQTAVIMFRVSKLWIRSEIFPSMIIEFTPEGGYVASVFGGFIVIISSYLGIAMTSSQSIVGDIPLRRMLLTPTNRLEVVVAKVLAYVIIGFFQSLLLISLWIIAFDLNLNTDFLSLVLIMTMISLTGSTTGILISAVASTRLQANQIFLFVMFGTLILSGFFIDVGFIDQILPFNQGLKLLIDTTFKGLNLLEVSDRILRLMAFSIFAILGATVVFAKKPTLG